MAKNTYTFPREVRLLNSGDYDKVFKKPVRASVTGVTILVSRNGNPGYPRLGLVIPKKCLKRAVWRNRVKRIIRESFRLNQHTLPSADFVVMARPKIGEINNTELRSVLKRLWDQISHRLAE